MFGNLLILQRVEPDLHEPNLQSSSHYSPEKETTACSFLSRFSQWLLFFFFFPSSPVLGKTHFNGLLFGLLLGTTESKTAPLIRPKASSFDSQKRV